MNKNRRFDLGTNVFVDFNNVLRHILQGNAGQKLEPSTIKGATLQNEFYIILQVTACTAVRVLYTSGLFIMNIIQISTSWPSIFFCCMCAGKLCTLIRGYICILSDELSLPLYSLGPIILKSSTLEWVKVVEAEY